MADAMTKEQEASPVLDGLESELELEEVRDLDLEELAGDEVRGGQSVGGPIPSTSH